MPKDIEPSSLSGANRILADALRYYAGRRPMSNPKGWGHVLRRYEAARHSIFPDVSDAQWDEALEVLRLLAEEHPDPIGGPRTVREDPTPAAAPTDEATVLDEAAAAMYEASRESAMPTWLDLPEGLRGRYVRGVAIMLPILQSGGTRMEAAMAHYDAIRIPGHTGTWNTLDSVPKGVLLAQATALEAHLYDTALAAAEAADRPWASCGARACTTDSVGPHRHEGGRTIFDEVAEVPSGTAEALAETATRTVTLLQEGRLPEFFSGVGALAEHAPEEVLLELTRQVLAAADGADLEALVATTLMPDPDTARTIARAVRADDWDLLRSVVATGYPNVVTALLATTAALKETTS